MRASRAILILVAGVFCSCSAPRLIDPVLPESKAKPEIYRVYRRDGDAKLADGWIRGMDMSGVAFDAKMTATLVSRRHVVMAAHYIRKVGDQVIFHDRTGKFLERKLVEVAKVHGDIAVGLLDEPVPDQYRSYPLPSTKSDARKLIGRPVVVTDQHRRIFFHRIQAISPLMVFLQYDVQDRHGWGKKLIAGDSGNPSFLIVGRELVLLETHTTGGAGAGPYFGSEINQQKLGKIMKEMDPQYSFRTILVE